MTSKKVLNIAVIGVLVRIPIDRIREVEFMQVPTLPAHHRQQDVMQPGELDGAGYGDAPPHGRLDAFEFHAELVRLRGPGAGLCREFKKLCSHAIDSRIRGASPATPGFLSGRQRHGFCHTAPKVLGHRPGQ